MTVLPLKQDSTEHRLKWRKRKQALLAYTKNIKIQIEVFAKIEKNTS